MSIRRFGLERVRVVSAAALFVLGGILAAAYPVPARIPTRWELTFAPGDLRLYVDDVSGRPYWYFTYKVVNNTGQDRYWAPRFTLFTDSGEIVASGERVPSYIETDLIALVNNPYLERQNQVIGRIFVGEENAIEGLVAWPAESLDVNELSIFIGGISGETAEVAHPITGEKEVLQKSLRRDYRIPGSAAARGDDPVEVVAHEWVMR